jgi:hypothetical protein
MPRRAHFPCGKNPDPGKSEGVIWLSPLNNIPMQAANSRFGIALADAPGIQRLTCWHPGQCRNLIECELLTRSVVLKWSLRDKRGLCAVRLSTVGIDPFNGAAYSRAGELGQCVEFRLERTELRVRQVLIHPPQKFGLLLSPSGLNSPEIRQELFVGRCHNRSCRPQLREAQGNKGVKSLWRLLFDERPLHIAVVVRAKLPPRALDQEKRGRRECTFAGARFRSATHSAPRRQRK